MTNEFDAQLLTTSKPADGKPALTQMLAIYDRKKR